LTLNTTPSDHDNIDQSATIMGKSLALFWVSFLILFCELALIRWIPGQVRLLAYFTNFILLASFLGMGVGCLTADHRRNYLPLFPILLLCLILLVKFIPPFGLDVSTEQTEYMSGPHPYVKNLDIHLVLGGFFILTALVFVPLGQIMGRYFTELPRIRAYTVNVAGSLIGIAAFSYGSFLGIPPLFWFVIVCVGTLPFLFRYRVPLIVIQMILLGMVLFLINQIDANFIWSPYYKIEVVRLLDKNTRKVAGYELYTNHDYHQSVLDMRRPAIARDILIFPFKTFNPKRVLVIGSGSGNDVAAALASGVQSVDAVEIDPKIVELGKQLHPNQPYLDPRVKVTVTDGRAFYNRVTR